MDMELLKLVLIVAIGGGTITTALVQKIKESFNFKNSKILILVNFIISMIVGTFFAKTFSELTLVNCIWVGLITFIGADVIYQSLEDKIFTKFSDIDNTIIIERSDEI